MTMQRIQQKRTRGWRKPAGVVYVGRPTRWGNPYSVDDYGRDEAVKLYRQHLATMPEAERTALLAPLRTAAGLSCWCKPGECCHADVLLEYLNGNA